MIYSNISDFCEKQLTKINEVYRNSLDNKPLNAKITFEEIGKKKFNKLNKEEPVKQINITFDE